MFISTPHLFSKVFSEKMLKLAENVFGMFWKIFNNVISTSIKFNTWCKFLKFCISSCGLYGPRRDVFVTSNKSRCERHSRQSNEKRVRLVGKIQNHKNTTEMLKMHPFQVDTHLRPIKLTVWEMIHPPRLSQRYPSKRRKPLQKIFCIQ